MPQHRHRVSVVGLGAMGAPMARVLLRAGYLVTVIPHRSRTAAEELAAEGAEIAETVADAAPPARSSSRSSPPCPIWSRSPKAAKGWWLARTTGSRC